MRYLLVALTLAVGSVNPARAQVSIGFGVDIGISVPVFPELVVVPGYPVYYAPRADVNYFFYDGVYWVYQGDNWYASSWYDGPWRIVEAEYVPLYVLRVPVRYYSRPPQYFRGWRADAPPRWGERWGRGWERRRAGWDRWDHRSVPRPAPLPVYQRQYRGDRYPRAMEEQASIGSAHYRYRPRETVVRERFPDRGYPRGAQPTQYRDPPRAEPHFPGGPRAESFRVGGPRAEPQYPQGPQGEPPRQGPGPQGPRDGDHGRGHGNGRGPHDDDRGDDHDGRGHGRH